MLRVAVVRLVGQAEAGLAEVQQIAGRVLGVGVDVEADAAADAGLLQLPEHRGQRLGGRSAASMAASSSSSGCRPRSATVCSSMKLAYRSPMRWARSEVRRSSDVAADAASDDQVADLLLGAVVQRPERAVGGAVAGHLVLGQPAAVDMAEQVVLGAGIGVDVAQVDTRSIGFYRHPTRLPDRSSRPRGRGRQVPSRACPTTSRDRQRRRRHLHRLWHRLGCARRHRRRRDRAGRADLDTASRRRRRAASPHPRHAGRRRVDRRADQHEQGHRRRQHGQAARGHGRTAQRRLRRLGRSPTASWSRQLQSRTTGQVDSVAVEYVHHDQPGRPGRSRPRPSCPRSPRAPTP